MNDFIINWKDLEPIEPPKMDAEFLKFSKQLMETVSQKLGIPIPAYNAPVWPFAGPTASPYGYTNASTTAGSPLGPVTIESILLVKRQFEILQTLPDWITSPGAVSVARGLALAEACFKRSLNSLATYHRLPRRI